MFKVSRLCLCPLLFFAIFLGCRATIESGQSSPIKDDSGVPRNNYEKIIADLIALAQDKSYEGLVEVVKESKGSFSKKHDFVGFRIGLKDGNFAKRRVIFLTEAIHGNEYLNIADRMIVTFFKGSADKGSVLRRFIEAGGILMVIPISNPDAYELGQRRNLHLDQNGYGKDLNRDWADPPYDAVVEEARRVGPAFQEPETRFMKTFVENELQKDNRQLVLTMGHHCCVDYLFFPWLIINGKKNPDLSSVEDDYNAFGEIYRKNFNMTYGIGGNMIVGTMDRYFSAKYPSSINLTFEAAFPLEKQSAMADKEQSDHLPMKSLGLTESSTDAAHIAKLLDLDTHVKTWDEIFAKFTTP